MYTTSESALHRASQIVSTVLAVPTTRDSGGRSSGDIIMGVLTVCVFKIDAEIRNVVPMCVRSAATYAANRKASSGFLHT